METYILIAACYGIGCYLSYNLGWHKGRNNGVNLVIKLMAHHFKLTIQDVARDILAMAERAREKIS
jgi:hypothetical protein